ncbi:mannose-1-phosphate guanylyltransferase/mannose-6-phosphate isomerase [Hydrogenophilus thermoluteolus]|uniref:mannose-1-phosphate guanylyltransferase/mannose-6-phosphate isomerase n=1 Tax=Hydrogenophilus thermoluteolus TaxID=297 RepID=UPI000E64E01A
MLLPVILSGGAGTRLWPVSREAHPKPFIRLPDGQSLLQKTFLRAASLPGVQRILTVTNRDYYFQTKDEYQPLAPSAEPIYLLEPCSRNTAPAVALAALYAHDRFGLQTTLLILPADHLIKKLEAFHQAFATAVVLAQQGWLVTFGITPSAPETGFGYIEAGDPLPVQDGAGRVAVRFVEKPDAVRAAEYLAAGRFFWNAGMFCFTAEALLTAMETTCPDLFAAARTVWQQTEPAANPVELPKVPFNELPDISIDYALMEKAANVAVVPCDLGWSDIGSWNALVELAQADDAGNRTIGETMLLDCHNTFVQSEAHLVAAVGVQDLIIVDTPDATLVAHKEKAQDVKRIVKHLKDCNHEAFRVHRTVYRPWGSYTVLEERPRFKIKRIEVKPGASLSLQLHHHRSEHWVVVTGMAKVINGSQEFFVRPNESTYIPAGQPHRLMNPGTIPLIMIEVQCGEYLGEDDIVRIEDQYGRKA